RARACCRWASSPHESVSSIRGGTSLHIVITERDRSAPPTCFGQPGSAHAISPEESMHGPRRSIPRSAGTEVWKRVVAVVGRHPEGARPSSAGRMVRGAYRPGGGNPGGGNPKTETPAVAGVLFNAEGGTRTRTGLRPLRPERSASTNSTTSAEATERSGRVTPG